MGLVKLASKHIWKKMHIKYNRLCNKVGVKALQMNIIIIIIRFIHECIFIKFGYPLTLVIDQKVHFTNEVI